MNKITLDANDSIELGTLTISQSDSKDCVHFDFENTVNKSRFTIRSKSNFKELINILVDTL